jgi:hypothetical protein
MKKKKLLVRKSEFDEALSAILKTKPMPREKIKASGRHAAKTPILSRP